MHVKPMCAVLIAVLVLSGCARSTATLTHPLDPPASDLVHAEPWPEADALFRSDPRWRGSDDAYSIDLGEGRVLWLFADTFIAESAQSTRRRSTMIRNSIGIQSGYDPSTASIAFYWRMPKGRPASFFAEQGKTWFWPGHGIVLGDGLLVFLMAIRSSSEGLGFETYGWRAVWVTGLEQDPLEWHLEWLDTPRNPFGLVVSASVFHMGQYVYAYSVQEPDHTIHLVRWPLAEVLDKDLSRPQWWDAGRGWVVQGELLQVPSPLFSEGQNEFTVHYEPALDRFLEIQTVGFGQADLGLRLADAPTGPWMSIERFYRPEECHEERILIYAAKAHPHLAGADLVLTYATNTFPYARLVRREDLYYPRFLRTSFEK